jgi:hypothetical protein
VLSDNPLIPKDTVEYIRANLRAGERTLQRLYKSGNYGDNFSVSNYNEGLPQVALVNDLHYQARRQLSYDIERYHQIKAAYNTDIPAIQLISVAERPIMKIRPKRTALVVASTVAVFLFTLLAAPARRRLPGCELEKTGCRQRKLTQQYRIMSLPRVIQRLTAISGKHPQGWLVAVCMLVSRLSVWAGIAFDALWLILAPAALLIVWLVLVDIRKVFFLMTGAIPLSVEQALPGWIRYRSSLRTVHVAPHNCSHRLVSDELAGCGWKISEKPCNYRLAGAFVLDYRHHGKFSGVFHFPEIYPGQGMVLHRLLLSRSPVSERGTRFQRFPVVVFCSAGVCNNDCSSTPCCQRIYFRGGRFRHVAPLQKSRHVRLSAGYISALYLVRHLLVSTIQRKWLILAGGILYLLFAINFAYTRAAYVALLAAVGVVWVVRFRLMKATLVAVALFFTTIVAYLGTRDNWLAFAPDYEKTISHTRFDNLLEATVKLEDISTMERVYRWVAASYMIKDRPLTGFGPGCFYTFYKNYTVSSFRTYVSDNPERSGIHNYFLDDNGRTRYPGTVFLPAFLRRCHAPGESLYHTTRIPWRRNMLMAALLCFVLTNLLTLMNDFVETDKIGSLFIMSAAILANGSTEEEEV